MSCKCPEITDQALTKGMTYMPIYDATPVAPIFFKNGEQCQGCGDSLWTNGQGAYDCKSCGGGIKPPVKKVAKKSYAPGGEILHLNSQMGIQFHNPMSTFNIDIQ